MKELLIEIFCLSCGYLFTTTVKSSKYICPRCKMEASELHDEYYNGEYLGKSFTVDLNKGDK